MSDELNNIGFDGEAQFAIAYLDGDPLYVAAETIETWGSGSRTISDYFIAMTWMIGNNVWGDMPSGAPSGTYKIVYYYRAGAAPALGDLANVAGYQTLNWNIAIDQTASAASHLYDQLQGIRTQWRQFTGLSEAGDISDTVLNIRINDHYVNQFSKEVRTDNFQADYTIDTTAVDTGSYSLPSNIIDVRGPVWVDRREIELCRDQERFWARYGIGADQDYITPPTLAIGTSSAAAVKNSAFSYQIGQYTYSKAAAETALAGDTIPDGKYGAYLLSIDEDGTITVTDGATNATGWDTAAQAINDLPGTPADEAVMGYVVVYTSGATFIPGTTLLSAATVTDTYTDGRPDMRGMPEACLVVGRTLIVRPKPMDIYRITFPMLVKRPDELSADDSTVFNEEWGAAIAMGDAIAYLVLLGADEKSERLMGRPNKPGTYEYIMRSIKGEKVSQEQARVVMRSW
ncbi:MAG TPA: hypothetical protein VMW24_19605 [Sedimentisphaerales bacterium]|nr:hypothetical protein [Sedimentisphaerales bacterium]